MTLDKLAIGKNAKITQIGGEGALRCHLLDMGLTPRAVVRVTGSAPMGDPIEISIRGYDLTIRIDDARLIEVEEEKTEAVK